MVIGRETERRSAGHHARDLVRGKPATAGTQSLGGDPPIPPQNLSQEPPQSVGGGVSGEEPGGGDGDGGE